MRRLLFALVLVTSQLLWQPVAAQQAQSDEMINAQLRFIKEHAKLNKREYQRFAKIYLEYNKKLYELNKQQFSRPVSEQFSVGGPFGLGMVPPGTMFPDTLFTRDDMPFSPPADGVENEYVKRWREINSDYLKSMEKSLPDTTRSKIGVAQIKLAQRLWREFSEIQSKIMENQRFEMRERQIEMMRNFSRQRQYWDRNFRRDWSMPDTVESLPYWGWGQRPVWELPQQPQQPWPGQARPPHQQTQPSPQNSPRPWGMPPSF